MAHVQLLDFDDIDAWFPQLAPILKPLLPPDADARLQKANPKFVEDARDHVFELGDRDQIIDAVIGWICGSSVLAYHGTRLIDNDVENVAASGLMPLTVEKRRDRIVRALSSHPRWNTAADRLDAVLRDHGPGSVAGAREGQVHLTLSRSGLTRSFNHYLTHGAEVDQHIAHALLAEEGKACLRRDGQPRLISIKVSGDIALAAAHPHFSIEETRARSTTPNLVGDFLKAWSFRLAHPTFQSRTLEVDCGLVFRHPIEENWVYSVETLLDEELRTGLSPLAEKTANE